MMHLVSTPELPPVFPGTPAAFQHVAWGIMIALALGSAGHLAEIFRAARMALGRFRLEQARVLGLSSLDRVRLLAREAAAIALSFRSRTSLVPFRGRRTPRSACSTLPCSGVRST
jgi:ABC-type amino acid transport system permease subunit